MADTKVNFLNSDGSLSGDGQALVAYIEGQFIEADQRNDIERLNSLSGMIGHYYVNVYKARAMTPEKWVKEYPNGANNAWSAKLYTESQQQQAVAVEDQGERLTQVEASLKTLKEELMAELSNLIKESISEAVQPAPEPAKAKGKKAKVEADEQDEDAESEA